MIFKYFLLFLTIYSISCASSGLISDDGLTDYYNSELYQAVWYIKYDDSSNPPRHVIGMKNFISERELGFFTIEEAMQISGQYIPYMHKRNYDDNVDDKYSGIYETVSEDEHLYYKNFIPTIEFYDSRDIGFGVVEDIDVDDVNYSTTTFCYNTYYYTQHKSLKKARMHYESLKLQNKKVALINSSTLLDSSDFVFFYNRYLSFSCPYFHGLWSNFMLHDTEDSDNNDNKYHVYLIDSINDPVADIDIPVSKNVSDTGLNECDMSLSINDSEVKELYIPSESNVKCFKGFENAYDSSKKTYIACNNKSIVATNSNDYYRYLGKCKKENRTFLILRSLEEETPDIIFTITCTGFNTAGNNGPISETVSYQRNNPYYTFTITEECAFTPLNDSEYNICVSQVSTGSCTLNTVTPLYVNMFISNIVSNSMNVATSPLSRTTTYNVNFDFYQTQTK